MAEWFHEKGLSPVTFLCLVITLIRFAREIMKTC